MQFTYKNYEVKANFSSHTKVFYGEVLNANELIAFQAGNLKDLRRVAIEAIEDRLIPQLALSD